MERQRQFRPNFCRAALHGRAAEHFRLLKLSSQQRRWQRPPPPPLASSHTSSKRPSRASSCASPMRDLRRRRERTEEEGTRFAIPLRRSRSSSVPRAKFKRLLSSLSYIVWFGWPLEIKRSSSSLLLPPHVPFFIPRDLQPKPKFHLRPRADLVH